MGVNSQPFQTIMDAIKREYEGQMTSPVSGQDASSILEEAAQIVAGARNTTHGDKERSFEAIAGLWAAYLAHRRCPPGTIRPRDVANMMALLKMARAEHGEPVRDHFVDAAGYMAIAGELAP